MRIDRQAFFAAVAALAGCQQDRSQLHDQPMPEIHLPRPTAAVAATRVLPPEPVRPLPVPAPPPPAPRHRQTPKQWFHDLTSSQRKKVESSCTDFLARRCEASLRRMLPPPRGEEARVVAFENQPVEFAPAASDRFAFVPGAPGAGGGPAAAAPGSARGRGGGGK